MKGCFIIPRSLFGGPIARITWLNSAFLGVVNERCSVFFFFLLKRAVHLSSLSPQPHRILQALRRYVRAENKDRQHTIRHYQHVLAVDPDKAAQMKSQVRPSVCLSATLPLHRMAAG